MPPKAKRDFSIGGDVTRLSIDMLRVQAQVRALVAGEKPVEDLETKLTTLKDVLASIKLRNSRGIFLEHDKSRILALEVEIGKIVLQMDGVL